MAECIGALVVKDEGKHLAFGSEMRMFPFTKTHPSIPLPLPSPVQMVTTLLKLANEIFLGNFRTNRKSESTQNLEAV